jgi:hypothetical protein
MAKKKNDVVGVAEDVSLSIEDLNAQHEQYMRAESDRIISENMRLDWIRRGVALNTGETVDYLIHPETGKHMTHELMYDEESDDEGTYYNVYPKIVNIPDRGLTRLTSDEAWHYQRNTHTGVVIRDKAVADYFSKNGLIEHRTEEDVVQ